MSELSVKSIRVLIVYPNIPLMLVTPLAIAIFTWILKKNGHIVELFDSTKYTEENLSSPENRVKYLQARKTSLDSLDSYEVKDKSDLLNDFQNKLNTFKPELCYIHLLRTLCLEL